MTARLSCPVSLYCDEVGCHVMCVRHGFPLGQYSESITATSRRGGGQKHQQIKTEGLR